MKLPNYKLRYLAVFGKYLLCFNSCSLSVLQPSVITLHLLECKLLLPQINYWFVFVPCQAVWALRGFEGTPVLCRAPSYSFGWDPSCVEVLLTAQSLVQSRRLPGGFTQILKVVPVTRFALHNFKSFSIQSSFLPQNVCGFSKANKIKFLIHLVQYLILRINQFKRLQRKN